MTNWMNEWIESCQDQNECLIVPCISQDRNTQWHSELWKFWCQQAIFTQMLFWDGAFNYTSTSVVNGMVLLTKSTWMMPKINHAFSGSLSKNWIAVIVSLCM